MNDLHKDLKDKWNKMALFGKKGFKGQGQKLGTAEAPKVILVRSDWSPSAKQAISHHQQSSMRRKTVGVAPWRELLSAPHRRVAPDQTKLSNPHEAIEAMLQHIAQRFDSQVCFSVSAVFSGQGPGGAASVCSHAAQRTAQRRQATAAAAEARGRRPAAEAQAGLQRLRWQLRPLVRLFGGGGSSGFQGGRVRRGAGGELCGAGAGAVLWLCTTNPAAGGGASAAQVAVRRRRRRRCRS